MARAMLAVRRASKAHADRRGARGEPFRTTSSSPGGSLRHAAGIDAPVRVRSTRRRARPARGEVPETPLSKPLMSTARAIERWASPPPPWSCSPMTLPTRAVREGLLRGDSEVVLNGWSLPDVPQDPQWREDAEHLLAYVGTIGEQDNVDHLVDAVAVMQARGRVKVVVAGDGSALEAVKKRARVLGVAPSFDWLGLVTRAHSDRITGSSRGRLRGARDRFRVQPARDVREDHRVHVGRRARSRAQTPADRSPGRRLRELRSRHDGRGTRRRHRRAPGCAERGRALGTAARRRFDDRISWERVGGPRLVSGYDRLFGSSRAG